MGYTHYWYQKRPFTQEEWDKITEESKRVCTAAEAQRIVLAGNMGAPGTTPEFAADHISFNGLEPEEDCETFYLERTPSPSRVQTPEGVAKEGVFNFCKTRHLPYDAAVVTILHFCRSLAPDAITVSSDGDEPDFDPIRKEL